VPGSLTYMCAPRVAFFCRLPPSGPLACDVRAVCACMYIKIFGGAQRTRVHVHTYPVGTRLCVYFMRYYIVCFA